MEEEERREGEREAGEEEEEAQEADGDGLWREGGDCEFGGCGRGPTDAQTGCGGQHCGFGFGLLGADTLRLQYANRGRK